MGSLNNIQGDSKVFPWTIYRVRVKSFPDYKHLLQENYVEYKHIFCVEVY